jgi:hypothetical protein
LVIAIETFIQHYNEIAEPFVWKNRAVRAFRMNVLSLPLEGEAGVGMGLVVGKTDEIPHPANVGRAYLPDMGGR